MRIGIDASKAVEKQKTGIGNTVYPILTELKLLDKENRYELYANKSLPPELLGHNFSEKIIKLPRLWQSVRLPLALRKDKPDAFLELSNRIPKWAPKKTIVFLHDFAFKYFPECYSGTERYLQELAVKNAIKYAYKIVVTSEANKKDFLKFYSCSSEKIAIIPLGFNDSLHGERESVSAVEGLNAPFFLSVGRLEKRKNTSRIVEAFIKFKKETLSQALLILVGKNGYGAKEIRKLISREKKIRKDIIVLGFIKNAELSYLYSNALALIYPSLYEGFGFPALEAMSCGTPVLTSDAPTLKEVAGRAALFVNPKKVEEIAAGMIRLYKNPGLRDKLITAGRENIKKFSWREAAAKLKELINEE